MQPNLILKVQFFVFKGILSHIRDVILAPINHFIVEIIFAHAVIHLVLFLLSYFDTIFLLSYTFKVFCFGAWLYSFLKILLEHVMRRNEWINKWSFFQMTVGPGLLVQHIHSSTRIPSDLLILTLVLMRDLRNIRHISKPHHVPDRKGWFRTHISLTPSQVLSHSEGLPQSINASQIEETRLKEQNFES